MPKASPRFKDSLSDVEGAGQPEHCYQCSACVAECPAARKFEGFNPREIVLASLLGVADYLTDKDSVIWQCATCYKCYERCPQGTRPVEVITALKNVAAGEGNAPEENIALTEAVLTSGSLLACSGTLEKRRSELGLPPAGKSTADLKALMGR